MKRVDTGPRMCAPVTYTQPLLLLDDLFADSETKSKKLAKKRRDKITIYNALTNITVYAYHQQIDNCFKE